ncbi:O-antigen ligase family protein [Myxococcaceae bacterium JPH2]|nr:O-antigen ligase family protein [Myxococcaceae bacterium JPH2]
MHSIPRPSYWRYAALIAVLGLACIGGAAVSDGNPVIAMAPVAAATVLWVMLKIPLRYQALAVFYLVLAVDYTPERPQSMLWRSPLFPLGQLLFSQLHELVGIGALRFPLVDVLIISLIGLGIYRRATRSTIDPPVIPLPKPLIAIVALSAITILWMEVWGIINGGDVKNSLWQWHQAACMPLMVMMFHYSLRGPEDWPAVARTVIAGALTKSAVSTYFALVVIPSLGKEVEYTTCHSDSMTFIFALMVCIARWLERPKLAHALRGILIIVLVFIGMFFNDRRLAYVSMVGSIAAAYLFNPWTPLKKLVTRAALLLMPVGVLYMAAGWNSSSGIFKPVQTVRSLVDGQHAEGELDYRDIENLNLIATWRSHPIIGTGYGHEFVLDYPMPDIAFVFPQFRYHPHNSLLGLLAFGGVLGFTGIWMYLVATVYLIARAYHRSHAPEHRAAALVIIGVVASYLNQVFGDMGIISYICTMLVAVSVAMTGKLAMVTGAWPWPARERVLGLRPVQAPAPLAEDVRPAA